MNQSGSEKDKGKNHREEECHERGEFDDWPDREE